MITEKDTLEYVGEVFRSAGSRRHGTSTVDVIYLLSPFGPAVGQNSQTCDLYRGEKRQSPVGVGE